MIFADPEALERWIQSANLRTIDRRARRKASKAKKAAKAEKKAAKNEPVGEHEASAPGKHFKE